VGSLFWWVFLFLLMPLIGYSLLLFPNNGMLASAAAVVFLLVLVLVTGVLAVVVGIRSQRHVASSGGLLRGRSTAIAGWVSGLCGLVIAAAQVVFFLIRLVLS
jgi:hypothetical protein